MNEGYFEAQEREAKSADLTAFIARAIEHRDAPPACKGCLRELPVEKLAAGICDACAEDEGNFEDIK